MKKNGTRAYLIYLPSRLVDILDNVSSRLRVSADSILLSAITAQLEGDRAALREVFNTLQDHNPTCNEVMGRLFSFLSQKAQCENKTPEVATQPERLASRKGDEPFISRYELADVLKVSLSTIVRYEKRGWIPVHKIGTVHRYLLSEVKTAMKVPHEVPKAGRPPKVVAHKMYGNRLPRRVTMPDLK